MSNDNLPIKTPFDQMLLLFLKYKVSPRVNAYEPWADERFYDFFMKYAG